MSGNTVDKMTIDNAQAAEIWAGLKLNNIVTKEKQLSNEYKALSDEEQMIIIKEALDEEYQPFTLSIQKFLITFMIQNIYQLKMITNV